jgi:hypothetical protein
MCWPAEWQTETNVSEEPAAPILRVEIPNYEHSVIPQKTAITFQPVKFKSPTFDSIIMAAVRMYEMQHLRHLLWGKQVVYDIETFEKKYSEHRK